MGRMSGKVALISGGAEGIGGTLGRLIVTEGIHDRFVAALADIEQEAHRRWPLDATLIIHRFGRLEPGEDIVLVHGQGRRPEVQE